MSEELAVIDVSGLLDQGEFHFGIVSPTGIVLKDDISESTWLELAKNAIGLWEKLGQKHLSMSMKVADILNWGEEHLGERYAQAIDLTRRSLIQQSKTVENWMRVFRAVPPSRRRENLTYSHHEAVVKLDATEQEEFLQRAEDEGLTVKTLRSEIQERHPRKPRASKKTVVESDNPASALQKLIDVSNFLSENPDAVNEKWKGPLSKLHLVFRRKWQGGHRKK